MWAILPGGKAEVAEDDVLDALVEEVAAVRDRLDWILADQPEDHRQIVNAQRPERVLVRAHDPQVLPVRVDAEHVAELSGVDELLQLAHAGVVEKKVARHEHEVALGGEHHELVHLGALHRRRFLHEDVLAGLERLFRERVVCRDGRGDDDGVELGIGEQLGVVGRHTGAWVARGERRAVLLIEVAEPGQVGEVVEVPRQVRAPVAEADQADGGHGSQLPDSVARSALLAGRVAEVHDHGVAVDERLIVDALVVGHDREAVELLRLERHRVRSNSCSSGTCSSW